MPFTKKTAGTAGSLGGSRRTEAQAQALKAMHQARRGVFLNESLPRMLREAIAVAMATGKVSLRGLAVGTGVNDRSLRRWLAGTQHPSPENVLCLRIALRRAVARKRRPAG